MERTEVLTLILGEQQYQKRICPGSKRKALQYLVHMRDYTSRPADHSDARRNIPMSRSFAMRSACMVGLRWRALRTGSETNSFRKETGRFRAGPLSCPSGAALRSSPMVSRIL
jgi:hypothetical protein